MSNNVFSEKERLMIKNKTFLNKRGEEKNYTYISQLLSKNGFFSTYVFGNMIRLSSFNSKEEFIKNYFKSGSKRKRCME